MDASLIDEGRAHAERLLLANGGTLGLVGASQAYQQVWARDSMLCGLGLLRCADPAGAAIHRRSLATLGRFQSPLGKIPHNVGLPNLVDPALIAHGGRLHGPAGEHGIEDSIHAGCVDGNLWYIVGHYANFVQSGDHELLQQAWPHLERALLWLRYQDSNECGLLEVHEAMDWADLFANRYNVLYDNVLYYAAWRCMGELAGALEAQDVRRKAQAEADNTAITTGAFLPPAASKRPSAVWYHERAEDVRRKLNALLWVGAEEPSDWEWIGRERREWLYVRRRVETELVERPFYLPYMAFRDYADRFDTLGNLLAILLGVADQRKTDKILAYIHGCGLNEPYPVRVLYPPIQPGEADWRHYYRVRNLNLPHHYHNGGAWPFVGGLYVAALVQAGRHAEAAQQFAKLAAMNRAGRTGEWEFNEWHHGTSGQPMGFAGQSWSTAMYIFAHDAVTQGRVGVFNRANGWF